MPAGERGFTAEHTYTDDNPSGTPADIYLIRVTVTDDDLASGQGTIALTVANVASRNTRRSLDRTEVAEGDPVALTVQFFDPGTEFHTLMVDWGDGRRTGNSVLRAGHVAIRRDTSLPGRQRFQRVPGRP